MEYYSAIKKDEDTAICGNMETWGHYAKWNKKNRGRQILYNLTYVWNLKIPNS